MLIVAYACLILSLTCLCQVFPSTELSSITGISSVQKVGVLKSHASLLEDKNYLFKEACESE